MLDHGNQFLRYLMPNLLNGEESRIKTTEDTEVHGVLVRKSPLLRETPWLKFFIICLLQNTRLWEADFF
jgi:hypothetical protein